MRLKERAAAKAMTPMERALGVIEIGACGIATSGTAFVLGVSHIGILIAIYATTVIAAYALIACVERIGPLTLTGND